MENQIRHQKETYLQTEIIDKGVDPREFEEFCEKIKGEDSDIDKWTLEEIIELVNQYKIQNFTTDFNFQIDESPLSGWNDFETVIPQYQTTNQSNQLQQHPQEINLIDLDYYSSIIPTNDQIKNAQNEIQQQTAQIIENTKQNINNESLSNIIKPIPIILASTVSQSKQSINELKKEITNKIPEKLDTSQIKKAIAVSPIAKRISEIQEKIPTKIATEIFSFSQSSQLICKKLGFNIFAQGVPQIKIIGSEKKTGGLFKSDYVMYNVKTGEEYSVQRRYSDFEWLQHTLHKLFPGVCIPSLSAKTASKTSTQTINKRTIMLEYFLNELSKSDLFRNSKYFVDFLRLSDQNQFKQLIKFGDKLTRPNKFEGLLNMTGQVIFIPDIKLNNFESYLQLEEQIYEKIKNLFKQISFQLTSINKIINDIQEQFTQLTQLCQKFEINQDYDPLFDMTKKLEEQISKCNTNQFSKMYNLFRYETLNFSSIKNLLKQRNEIQFEFQGRKDSKIDIILEPYKIQDTYKSFDELDFPSKNTKILAYQLGFLNWRANEEIKLFLNYRQVGFVNHAQSILT